MLDSSYFENHLGTKIEFGVNGIYVNYNTIRDYDWDFDKTNNIITKFTKSIQSTRLPIIIIGDSQTKRDLIYDIAEIGVLAEQKGSIVINGYAMECYITAITTTNYLSHTDVLYCNLTITTDDPIWRKGTIFQYLPSPVIDNDGAVEYPYDYPFDYSQTFVGSGLDNTSIGPCSFNMVVYGPAVNPSIVIGENTYSVAVTLEAGAYMILTADEKTKTITKTSAIGVVTNIFDLRNKTYDNFAKIEAGNNLISWDGSFGFDIEVIENRSEPKWSL